MRATLMLLVLLIGCGQDAPALPTRRTPRRTERAAEVPQAPGVYDQEGHLRESTNRIAGLVLPMGLRQISADRPRTVFATAVPLTDLIAYFGPRLVTAEVIQERSGAVTYRNALPTGLRGAPVHLEVRLFEAGDGQRRVLIEEEQAPATTGAPTDREVGDRLLKMVRESS